MDFFAPEHASPSAGVFSAGHAILLAVTAVLVVGALYFSRRTTHAQVRNILRVLTVILWGLEIWKILFNFSIGNADAPDSFVPLYYCSLSLYAGAMSAFGRGWVRRVGDVFLATGGIVGGVCFLLLPVSSLTIYPAFHFIAFHSFILHGMMTYMGVLLWMRDYVTPKKRDSIGFFLLILVICIPALIVNLCCDSNLMFISYGTPNTPLAWLDSLTGPFFTPLMILGQATLPFWGVFGIYRLVCRVKRRKNGQKDA